MALPVPNLDDRRFQDLVDDAKRLVQQRCPEWTDHNVSDPGVTLIEAFAWMTDQLLYRLNRVPDRHYVKFLELIGVRLFPPAAAARRDHVLAFRGAAGRHPDRRGDAGGDDSHRDRRRGRLHDARRPADRPGHARPRADHPGRQEARRPHHGGHERARLRRLRGAAGGGQPAARRHLRAGARQRGAPRLSVHDRGRRRRSHLAAAGVGGLDRRRLDALRAGARRHRRPQPGRRGGPPRAERPRGLGRREAPRRVAPRPGDGAGGGPAVLLRVAERPRRGGLHRRWHDRRGPCRRRRRRDRRHLRGRGRPALPAAATTGRPRRSAHRRAGLGRRGRLAGVDAGARLLGSGPDDRHFVLDTVAGEISFGPAVRGPDGSVRSHGAVPRKGAGSRSTSTSPAAAGSGTSPRGRSAS